MQRKASLLLLLQRIFLLMIFYSACRLLFLLFNFSYFADNNFSSTLKDFFFGLRFDITAIVISNIFFIALHINPFSFFYSRVYQFILKFIFIAVNSVAILLNCVDFIAFNFSSKRATSEIFKIMSFGEDFVNTVPRMMLDFWYVLFIFIVFALLLIYFYNRISIFTPITKQEGRLPLKIIKNIFAYTLCIAFAVFGFRGGMQYRPINIMTASQYGSNKDVALILNTPFSIIKTFGKNELESIRYFSDEEAEKISPLLHNYKRSEPFRKINVVILILESFGKEYIGSLNHYEGYTPFLDSLMQQSLVFTNAFANGKRSIEGIPAVIAGLPALLSEPFITSAYNGNNITSLASILKTKGYATSFFHGGTNGTMGFDNFCHAAGYEKYFGRREYNNDNDFDGNWGVADEPFFQYFAQHLNETKQPFFSTLFSISSHHPYSIPEKFKGKFRKGSLPIHESIMYADYSLKKFFETAQQSKWFDSTLFVVTGDHTALSEYPFFINKVGMYSVPIIFYMHNSTLKGVSDVTSEQIDILPGVLDYLNYDENFFAFGNSMFDLSANHFAVSYLNDTYQMIENNYSLNADTVKSNSLFHYTTDSLLQNNLINTDTLIRNNSERKLRAFIQHFNDAMIGNKMGIGKW